MDEKQCDTSFDRMVSAFLTRNPDLSREVHRNLVEHGMLLAATIAKIEKRMDEEA